MQNSATKIIWKQAKCGQAAAPQIIFSLGWRLEAVLFFAGQRTCSWLQDLLFSRAISKEQETEEIRPLGLSFASGWLTDGWP